MEFESTEIEGLYVSITKKLSDERGAFMRMYCTDSIKEKLGEDHNIKQINYSHTVEKGSIRGMHFQKTPALEGKIVRCIQGKILDVAVDLRKGSKTFLKHFAIELSEDNNFALMIPKGFAHGFQTLTDNCKMVYMHDESYSAKNEDGIKFDDPKLAIEWPLEPKNLSQRDLNFETITDDFKGI